MDVFYNEKREKILIHLLYLYLYLKLFLYPLIKKEIVRQFVTEKLMTNYFST